MSLRNRNAGLASRPILRRAPTSIGPIARPQQTPPESWIGLMQYAGLPLDRAVNVNAPALKKVLCGLIWEEVRRVRRVTLVWSGAGPRRPKPEDIVVTYFDAQAQGTIPTWWNKAVLRQAENPEVSSDGRTDTIAIPVDTFGLVVAVRGLLDASAYEVPMVRAFTPDVWKKMDLEIEWGFDKSTAALDYSGRIEAYDGVLDCVQPLAGDAATAVTEKCHWVSAPKGNGRVTVHGLHGRRGVRLSLLYLGTSRWRKTWPYNGEQGDVARTIVTVWTRSGNFSFLASDLEQGPILAPEYGFFVRATQSSAAPPAEAAFGEANSRELLDQKINAFLGNRTVRGWGAGADTPWFAGNATDRPVTVQGITFPSRGVAVHPGADRDVAVGWLSPMEGRVSLTGNVAHAQPGGGDGIEWSVVYQGLAGRIMLAQGVIDRGGAVHPVRGRREMPRRHRRTQGGYASDGCGPPGRPLLR